MSSAFYETTGIMKGSARDLEELQEVLRGYAQGLKDAYFMNLAFRSIAEGETVFSAEGPFGRFDRLNDVDVFREMAKAAPTAYFEATVEGGDSYTESELHCCLADGTLKTELSENCTEDDDRAYLEYVIGKMPYEQFINLYGIEADSLAEDDYEDFVSDLIIECSEEEKSPFDLDWDVFTGVLESYGGETSLDEEAYEIARNQAEELRIAAEYDFREEHDNSKTEVFVFDAMTGR